MPLEGGRDVLAIIDMKTSNIRSIFNAIRRVGGEATVTSAAGDIERASALVLPGVGAFEAAMGALHDAGLVDILRHRVRDEGIPILGICLGMQILAEASEEGGVHEGLGLIPGRVKRLRPASKGFRVPNIGWYAADATKHGVLFGKGGDAGTFYFVHSYHVECTDSGDIAATIDYGGTPVTAAVERENVFGVQFHPEKSQDDGLDLLVRFLDHVRGERRAA